MRTSNIVHTTESITERKKHVRDVQENWRSLWYHYTANGLIIQIQGAFIVTPRTVTTQIIVVITWFPLRICLWKSLFRFMSRHSVNKSHNTQSLNQSLTKHLLYFSTQCFFFALFVFVILRFFLSAVYMCMCCCCCCLTATHFTSRYFRLLDSFIFNLSSSFFSTLPIRKTLKDAKMSNKMQREQ